MSENKDPAMLTVDRCREIVKECLDSEEDSFDEAMYSALRTAYIVAGGRASDLPEDIYSTCRKAFSEKLSRTNDMDAAFVKMVWVAYKIGAKHS